jgi:ketosteroid isomerase-like protein
MTDDLDPIITAMFEATNHGDSDAFLACFAEDAVLDDWGRTFTGHAAIARWDANENIGVQSHIKPTGVTREGDAVHVGVEVSGNGYNGGGSFVFHTDGQRITRLEIRG